MQIPTLPNPDAMSAEERAAEITTILAACLLRISTAHQEKPEQKACDSEVRLGFLHDQRVHTTPSQQEELS
jgi:hypothetical protein